MIALEIKIGTNVEIIDIADELRRIIFIDEQGIPEEEIFDGLNLQAIHIVIFDGNAPAATARVLNDGNIWRIGLVAVHESKRGQHLGEKVMQVAIDYIISKGGREILLTAQQRVCGFYEKLKFVQCGKIEVLESGFVLVPMKFCV